MSISGLPALLRVDEAAAFLRISRTKVYELIKGKELNSLKVGGRRLVPNTAIGQYLDGLADG